MFLTATAKLRGARRARTNPVNAYGKTKLDGEQAVARSGCNYLIFRTSWVYDAYGKNFLNTILRLASERDELKIVADQIGAPSYAPMLAEATLTALSKACEMQIFPSGVYNLCNSGYTNWHEFACEIIEHAFRQATPIRVRTINPIKSVEYPTPAKRPYNSRLNLEKIDRVFGIKMPGWKQGLEECMIEKTNFLKVTA